MAVSLIRVVVYACIMCLSVRPSVCLATVAATEGASSHLATTSLAPSAAWESSVYQLSGRLSDHSHSDSTRGAALKEILCYSSRIKNEAMNDSVGSWMKMYGSILRPFRSAGQTRQWDNGSTGLMGQQF